jgi:hypothetical protein
MMKKGICFLSPEVESCWKPLLAEEISLRNKPGALDLQYIWKFDMGWPLMSEPLRYRQMVKADV